MADLAKLFSGCLILRRLPELATDLAVQPSSAADGSIDKWLPIQLKASESKGVRAWLRQVRHQIISKSMAYHGAIVLGHNSHLAEVLIVPIHRLQRWEKIDLLDPKWWVDRGCLADTLRQSWGEMGVCTTMGLSVLSATNANALLEAKMRRAFSSALATASSEFSYESPEKEFTAVDGFLVHRRTGIRLRCQERTGKLKTREAGQVVGLTVSTSRYCRFLFASASHSISHAPRDQRPIWAPPSTIDSFAHTLAVATRWHSVQET